MTDQDETCSVCHRGDAPVCDRCRLRMGEQLAGLPALFGRLELALVPGPGREQRVSTGKGEAPIPPRLAALSLVAGGTDDARCLFVPAVRVWTTVDSAPVGAAEGQPIRRWHREAVYDAAGRRVMTLADDQHGALPLKAWVRAWAREWRRALGHSTAPKRPRLVVGREELAALRATPLRRIMPLTVHLGIGSALPPTQRPEDPAAVEWAQRWPGDSWGPATRDDHAYLMTWLDEACKRLTHIDDFAASLRTLTGAVRAALDDTNDLEYLGRCPEDVEDRQAGTAGPCGASIWHDPYASVITCPRCHTETGQDRRIWLARRILDTWPIDRRRRYPRGLIEVLRDVQCPTCSAVLRVEWVSATEHADREPFWRPGALTCPNGCEVAL